MATLNGSLFCFSETLLNLWKQNTKQMKNSNMAIVATIWFMIDSAISINTKNYNLYFICMVISFLAYLIIRAIESQPND